MDPKNNNKNTQQQATTNIREPTTDIQCQPELPAARLPKTRLVMAVIHSVTIAALLTETSLHMLRYRKNSQLNEVLLWLVVIHQLMLIGVCVNIVIQLCHSALVGKNNAIVNFYVYCIFCSAMMFSYSSFHLLLLIMQGSFEAADVVYVAGTMLFSIVFGTWHMVLYTKHFIGWSISRSGRVKRSPPFIVRFLKKKLRKMYKFRKTRLKDTGVELNERF